MHYQFSPPETMMDVCAILNVLYASELVAEMQYWHHYYTIKGPFSGSLQSLLAEHAGEERGHRETLGELIMQLGGTPNPKLKQLAEINPDGDVKVLEEAETSLYGVLANDPVYRPLVQAVNLNLKAEESAKEMYQQAALLIRPFHAGAAHTLEEILNDETHHAHELRNFLP